MNVRKFIGKIHLWLGFISGPVVFIIAITGCLYAFQQEIQDLTQPFRFVEPQNKSLLSPSVIKEIADKQLPGKHIHAVLYEGANRAAKAIYYSKKDNYYYHVFINPYNGNVLKVQDVQSTFFYIVLQGHFYLWLPHDIGQPVVATVTLIFVIILFTGFLLWLKGNKGSGQQRFKIKWNARWRRKNYDFHRVLGFYVTSLAVLFACTGLVWGFKWFANSLYYVASGGKENIKYYEPVSPSLTHADPESRPAIDQIWYKMINEYPKAEAIEVHVPENATSSIAVNINPDASTYWKMDYRYFDQYTLKELSVNHKWGRYSELSRADKLFRMNYDIHVGAILGLPGKIIAFLASAICASLPVTGFLIWWGRRNKKKDKAARSSGLFMVNGSANLGTQITV